VFFIVTGYLCPSIQCFNLVSGCLAECAVQYDSWAMRIHAGGLVEEGPAPYRSRAPCSDPVNCVSFFLLNETRWDDIDFKGLDIRVTESIWHQVVGVCKTEASAKPVPMDEYMAEDLLRWRRSSPYPMECDWVFASPRMQCKKPYWPDNLMKGYIRPFAHKAGITKNIGWHTFRHSFGTLPKANGEDVKTVQEFLRHANSKILLDVYTQAANSHKRVEPSKVVRMMVPGVGQREVENDSLLVRWRA
jgi:hypothetical protein